MQERPWIKTFREYGIAAEVAAAPHASVTAMLEAAMQRYATKTAFVSFGQRLSFADVDRFLCDFAAWLQAQGVKRGDRIAMMTPNILAFPVAMLGIVRAGAVQVNVNPLYTARELAHQLQDAGAETIVIFNGSTATLAEVLDQTPVKRVVTAGLALRADSPLPNPPVDARLSGAVSMVAALTVGAQQRWTPVPLTADDLLFLQYTGGTTGLSKGAALTHGNLIANSQQFGLFMPDAMRPGEEVVVTAAGFEQRGVTLATGGVTLAFKQVKAEPGHQAHHQDETAFAHHRPASHRAASAKRRACSPGINTFLPWAVVTKAHTGVLPSGAQARA